MQQISKILSLYEDHCQVLLFADDTTIETEVAAPTTPSSQHHSHPLQVATDAALKWADSAGGRFNPTKSFQMTFSPRTNGPDPPNIGYLRMKKEEVRTVDTHRHLGVQIDSHLNFQCHIETITTKFRQRVVLLAHMSSRLTPEVTNRLYTGNPPLNTPRDFGSSNCPHPKRRCLSVCRPDWHESS